MRRTATVLAALAGFVPLPLPPGTTPGDESSIAELAASGNTWLARADAAGDLQLTADQGQTWRAITLESQAEVGIGVAPDGSFWVPLRFGTGHELMRVTASGVVSIIPLTVPGGLLSAPAWDAQNRMWVALGRPGADRAAELTAYRLNDDGSVAEEIHGSATRNDFPFVRFVGATGYIGTSGGTLQLRGGKLTQIAGLPSEDGTEF